MSEYDELPKQQNKQAPATTGTLNLSGSPKPVDKIDFGFKTNQAQPSGGTAATPASGIAASLYFVARTLIADAADFEAKRLAINDATDQQRLSQLILVRSAAHDDELKRIGDDILTAKLDANAAGSPLHSALGALDTAVADYTNACHRASEPKASAKFLPALKVMASNAQTTYEQFQRARNVASIPVVTGQQALMENLSSATKLADVVARNPQDPAVTRSYMDAVAGGREALALLEQLTTAERKKVAAAVNTFATAAKRADDARNIQRGQLGELGVAMKSLL